MPFFFEKAHYQAITHLLVAGDIQARVVSNDVAMSVEVKLEDGSAILWSNHDHHGWKWSRLTPEGEVKVGDGATIAQDASPDEVATFIARFQYDVAPVKVSSL